MLHLALFRLRLALLPLGLVCFRLLYLVWLASYVGLAAVWPDLAGLLPGLGPYFAWPFIPGIYLSLAPARSASCLAPALASLACRGMDLLLFVLALPLLWCLLLPVPALFGSADLLLGLGCCL